MKDSCEIKYYILIALAGILAGGAFWTGIVYFIFWCAKHFGAI